MFIRAKNQAITVDGIGREINIAVAAIESFDPSDNGNGSKIVLNSGKTLSVDLTCRAIRNAIRKAMAPFEMAPATPTIEPQPEGGQED